MQDKKAVTEQQFQELIEFYKQTFGIDWVRTFQETVKIHFWVEKTLLRKIGSRP